MWLFYAPDIVESGELPEAEAGHCIRVLRLKEGAGILITDGRGTLYDATITTVSGKRCMVRLDKAVRQPALWKGGLHVAVAPTKLMERNEWFVEKAVEIGADSISFLLTEHSERTVMKMDRIERVAVAAMKQSQKALLPVLNPMTPFKEFVSRASADCKFMAHCNEGYEKEPLRCMAQEGKSNLVLIGPEGDFSPSEIELALQSGFSSVSLGRSRLRTETAALVALHTMNLVNQI